MDDIKPIVEALIFAADSPVTAAKLKEVLNVDDTGRVKDAVNTLMEEYRQRAGGIVLTEVAGGYQFRTNPQYGRHVKNLKKSPPFRLTRASLETLAIVAYRQPVTRAEIEALRGVEVGGILRQLLTRGLVRITGRKDSPGRPILYGTTKKFLSIFDLKDLDGLPPLKEMEELDLAEEAGEE